MKHYAVVVGNIGTVHTGTGIRDAVVEYNHYVVASKENYGRASGESVTLLIDGEIHFEHEGRDNS